MAKNYLIVGGTSGIGKRLTELLTEDGHTVHAIARNEPSEPVQGVTYHQADVLEDDLNLDSLPDELHGIAYCVGTITLKPFKSLKAEQFRKDYELNVMGAVRAIQGNYKRLKKAKGAGVVLFSTVASTVGLPFHASVASAKSAVEGLAISMASELASDHIRVNLVAPSITDTPMAEDILKTDKQRENSAQRHPIESIGTPDDMAQAAAFLISEKARWVTGQKIGVDGGMSTLRGL